MMEMEVMQALNPHTMSQEETNDNVHSSRCVKICTAWNKTCLLIALLIILFLNEIITRVLNSENLSALTKELIRNKTNE